MKTHSNILAWEISWTELAWHATVHRVEKSQIRLSMYMRKSVFSIDFRVFI